MQIDMHYYGTYAMARAAGLRKDVCKVIATASQYVDDNAKNMDIELADGSCVHIIATAHHAASIKNISKKDQRKVWVPFHFLPGNEGPEFRDKLICRKNSSIVEQVKKYVLDQKDSDYFVELTGIFAHIYADTFSHYGFSGITDERNKVFQKQIRYLNVVDSIFRHLEERKEQFLARFAESTRLGHGAVFTYPDRPFNFLQRRVQSFIRLLSNSWRGQAGSAG